MLKALFIDLQRYRLREIFWDGGILTDQFDGLMQIGELDTERSFATIAKKHIEIIHTCGAADDRFGWQLIGNPHWTFYSSSVILGTEDPTYPYSCFYKDDCKLTIQELCENVLWCRMQWYNNDDSMGLRKLTWRANSNEIEV